MDMINRTEYPALDQILWDSTICQIPAEMAFQYYEKRWKYIDEAQLTAKEKQLIHTLTKTIGHGLFLTQ
ncbi:MAG: hypothetical protein LKF82_12265 [Acinetobacter populi]|jgi:hypothetical protein|uniref:hypothetical protein n=1 Tax=Acinetobacter populi TaxID=1582270 RepID=UPI002357BCE8|nr:hypothetical protein [Acinetobacter populi]MCH4248580.1 hypothetical protein [Acinetobacter populi]